MAGEQDTAADKPRKGFLSRLWAKLPPGLILLAFLSVVDIILGFGREAVVAYHFGASSQLDAFLIATTVPRMLVIQGVQITVALILPLYIGHIETGRRDLATALIQRWFRFLLKAGLVFTVIAGIFAVPLMSAIAPGLDSSLIGRSANWFRLLMPWVMLALLGGCFKVVLESNKKFLAPGLAGDLVSVTVIIACTLFAGMWGVSAMIPGFLSGAVLGFLIQWWPARKIEPELMSWRRLTDDIKLPLAGGGILLVQAFVHQANLLIDRGFASMLPPGSVAALNYANAINNAPANVVSAALATAIFPILARLAARLQWKPAFRYALSWTGITMAIGTVIAIPLIVMRHQLVHLMFQRGRFDAHAAALTSTVLSVLPWMIPVFAGTSLMNRLLMSQQRLRTILLISFLSIVLKVLGNLVMAPTLGILGVVLATLFSSVVALLVRVFVTWKYLPDDVGPPS